jgi:hypothetical protein
VLSSVETRSATVESIKYDSGGNEGLAVFHGPKGEVNIEKRNGRWIIHGDQRVLEIHELNHPFDDYSNFMDAVSCYLLSNISPKIANEPIDATTDPRPSRPWWKFWA